MDKNTEIMLKPEQEAVLITERIKDYGKAAVNAVCNIGRELRRMKIEGLFIHLGYETFEEYAEKEFDMKRRQSYLYISVYEKLGEDFVQSNAQLGITKLAMLTQLNTEERTELMESQDLDGMTTKEVEELVSKYKEQGKQLSMLQEENEELKKARDDDVIVAQNNELEQQVAELRERLKSSVEEKNELMDKIEELENTPKDVQVAEPVTKEVIKEVPDKKAIEKKDKEIAKLKKQMEELEASRDEQEQERVRQQEEYEARIEEMKKASEKQPENTDKSSFKAMFASAYKEITGLIEFVKVADEADKPVFAEKVKQLLEAAEKALKEVEADVDKR